MLVQRAFVWSVSPRALLAVAALSLSVAYALVSAGSLAGLGSDSATLAAAEEHPGWLLHDDGAPFDAARAPAGAVLVHTGIHNGTAVATIDPWPYDANETFVGPYAQTPSNTTFLQGLTLNTTAIEFAPRDHVVLPPDRFDAVAPTARDTALYAFVEGDRPPDTDLGVLPWQGVGTFYAEGAEQIVAGLVLVVLAAGAVAALLAGGFVRLEVLARRAELATLEALAGPRQVRRVVALRVVVLVVGGLLLGTAGAFAVTRVAQVAAGADAFRIGTVALVGTWAATGLGGVLFGVLAGRRALDTTGQKGRTGTPRRFAAPGPLRFLVVTPRLFPAVFAAMLVAGSILSVVIAASSVPTRLFASDETETVLMQTDGNPLRGSIDRFLGTNARFLDGVAAAMPETYAPTTLDGRPLLVKGTDFDAFRHYADPELVRGQWPTLDDEATIGARAARLLDLAPGDRVVLPTSYHRGAVALRITGVHQTGDLADDELFTSLDAGGTLAGIPADRITLVRVRLEDPTLPWSAVAPGRGIEIVGLRVEPAAPPPLTPAVVVVEAINFADQRQVRPVAVRLDDNVTAQDRIVLPAHGKTTVRYNIVTPAGDDFTLSVNPVREVGAGRTTLVVDAAPHAPPGRIFQITIRDTDGAPVPDAEVLVDGVQTTRSGANGNAFLTIEDPGLHAISARLPDASGGTMVRIAPLAWEDLPVLVVERLFLHPPEPLGDDRFRLRAEATIANLGGRSADETLRWYTDATNDTDPLQVRLANATRATYQTTFTLPYGTHAVSVQGAAENFTERITFTRADAAAAREAERPRTIEEVLDDKAAAAADRLGQRGDAAAGLLDKVFASLGPAIVLVVIATLLHSGALVWLAVVREVREREEIVHRLDAMGAAAHQVEARALRDAGLSVLPPLVLGALAAWSVLTLGAWFGLPAAFGHTLPTDGMVGVLVRTALALLVGALAAAFYAVQASRRRARASAPGVIQDEAGWLEAMR